MIEGDGDVREALEDRADARNLFEHRHDADGDAEGAGAFPYGARVVEPGAAGFDSVQPLFDLVRFPNLYLKFSSVTLYAAAREKSTPGEFLSRLVDSFGATRMMWGSNFPATNDRRLKDQYELARNELSFAFRSGPAPPLR